MGVEQANHHEELSPAMRAYLQETFGVLRISRGLLSIGGANHRSGDGVTAENASTIIIWMMKISDIAPLLADTNHLETLTEKYAYFDQLEERLNTGAVQAPPDLITPDQDILISKLCVQYGIESIRREKRKRGSLTGSIPDLGATIAERMFTALVDMDPVREAVESIIDYPEEIRNFYGDFDIHIRDITNPLSPEFLAIRGRHNEE